MRQTRLNIKLVPALLTALIAAPPGMAEGVSDVPLATENAGTSGISWQLSASYEEVLLTVSGPGYGRTEVFRGGASPSFQAIAASGAPLANGLYNYEIRVIPQPPAYLVSAVQRAADDRDEEAYMRLSTELQDWGTDLESIKQSGRFRMVGGSLEMIHDSDREATE
ncbi:MAG: hypothetical protein ACE5GX_06450 [Thermoanaerobaculia bacterium]